MKQNELRSILLLSPLERGVFSSSNVNEPILMVYKIIRRTISRIEVYNDKTIWYEHNKSKHQFPHCLKSSFHKVYECDEIVRLYLDIAETSEEKTIYEIRSYN